MSVLELATRKTQNSTQKDCNQLDLNPRVSYIKPKVSAIPKVSEICLPEFPNENIRIRNP